MAKGISKLETATGLGFGATHRPLIVSVRSGAAVSMPGMMETVLDVGMSDDTVEALIRLTGNPRLAWDSYRRLVQGYAEVVANLPTAPFDLLVTAALERAEADNEQELDHRDLRALTAAMLACYQHADRPHLPGKSARATRGGRRSSVPFMVCAKGGQLSPIEWYQ